MRTGCRGCLRRWCWSWSATLSFPSWTPWLRATPRGCSSWGTRRRKPSDGEIKRYKHPSDCVCAAAESSTFGHSHSQLNLTLIHSQRGWTIKKPGIICRCVRTRAFFFFLFFWGCMCRLLSPRSGFCSSSSSHSLGVSGAIGSTADLNKLL